MWRPVDASTFQRVVTDVVAVAVGVVVGIVDLVVLVVSTVADEIVLILRQGLLVQLLQSLVPVPVPVQVVEHQEAIEWSDQ